MCTFLHNIGELDGNMQPIGKENFHVFFASNEIPPENVDNINELEPNEPRPGTNKRKQYYRKKVGWFSFFNLQIIRYIYIYMLCNPKI